MTTPMAPSPHPLPPPPQPTALPPSPLTVGQAMGATVEILKRRFGFFVALAFVPGLLIAVVLIAGLALGGGAILSSLGFGFGYGRYPSGSQVAGALAVGALVMLVTAFVAFVIQIKANGLITLLAHETALGRRPDFAALNAGTRGIVGRTLVLLVAAVVAGGALSALLFVPLLGITAGPSNTAGDRLVGAALATMLLSLALSLGSLYLSTRWLYFNQGLAIEGRDGFAALGNSWRLTRNEFWRTLGWYLLAALAASVVLWIVVGVFGALTGELASSRSSLASGVGAALSVVYLLLIAVLEGLLAPALMIYTTVMYIDQQRRLQLAGGARGWPPPPGPGQPAWPAAAPPPSTWTPTQLPSPGPLSGPGAPPGPGAPGAPRFQYGYGPGGPQQPPARSSRPPDRAP
nr:hypothetical protein [Propionibacterium sp.]